MNCDDIDHCYDVVDDDVDAYDDGNAVIGDHV